MKKDKIKRDEICEKGKFKTTMNFKMKKQGVDGKERFESQPFQVVACLKIENFIGQENYKKKIWRTLEELLTLSHTH